MSTQPFEASAEAATADRVLSALSTEVRRSVIAYFEGSPTNTATVEELGETVAARQSPSAAMAAERVRLRLHHVDLPKLDDAGLLEYDARSRTARVRDDGPVSDWAALLAEADA